MKRPRRNIRVTTPLATKRGSDAEASESDAETRPKKAQPKKGTRIRARHTGKLRQMLDMPLEVILEICAHLHPKDTLNLSRASKDLRTFFLSRNSMSIWKVALANLPDLPPCPDDLSEPAYVNLMFSLQCHVCLNKNCQDVYWVNRLRLCDGCRKQTETTSYETLDAGTSDMIKPHKLRDLVPPIRYLYKCNTHPRYFRPALDEFVASLKKTPQAGREEFLRTRVEHIESRRKGASELREYLNNTKTSQANELDKQKVYRRDQIVERLKEAGYEQDTDYLFTRNKVAYNEFIMLPEVRKTQVLTPRIWKNIEERIFSFMEGVRENRLHDDRCLTLIARLDALEECIERLVVKLAPRQVGVLEVAYNIPQVSQILDPHVEEFDSGQLEKTLQETVPAYIEDRNTRYRQDLSTKIRKWLGIEASADPLALAVTSSLHCTGCGTTFTQTGALQHCCTRTSNVDYCPAIAHRHGMTDEFHTVLKGWGVKQKRTVMFQDPTWRTFEHGLEVAAAVIRRCGSDPQTASSHDMDEANARFLCPRHHYYAPVMDWRAVIHHIRRSHCQFRRATAEEVSAVKPLEAILEQERRELSTYRCGHCEDSREVTKEAVEMHLRNEHDITEPHEADCIDLRKTFPPPNQTYLLLPQKKDHPGSHALVREVLEKGIGIYFDYSTVEEKTS